MEKRAQRARDGVTQRVNANPRSRSVRAGTDQAVRSEGARGEGAARRTNIHLATHSCGRCTESTVVIGKSRCSLSRASDEDKWQTHRRSSGGGTLGVSLDGLKTPDSFVLHPSSAPFVPWQQEHRPLSPSSDTDIIAASKLQCSVAMNHRARSRQLKKGRIRRIPDWRFTLCMRSVKCSNSESTMPVKSSL